MKRTIEKIFIDHAALLQRLQEDAAFQAQLQAAIGAAVASLRSGGKILLCGNGGSASDAAHVAAELVGSFGAKTLALPAVALTADSAVLTATANDFGYAQVFARQVEALATQKDVLLVISTSGKSENVLCALDKAKQIGAVSIALCGENTESICADIILSVPSADTARIQEMHGLILHSIAECIKKSFENEENNG